jgi:hypothetical protein
LTINAIKNLQAIKQQSGVTTMQITMKDLKCALPDISVKEFRLTLERGLK